MHKWPDNLGDDDYVNTLSRYALKKYACDPKKLAFPYTEHESRASLCALWAPEGASRTRESLFEEFGVPPTTQKRHDKLLVAALGGGDDDSARTFFESKSREGILAAIDQLHFSTPGPKALLNDVENALLFAKTLEISKSGLDMSRKTLRGHVRALGRRIAAHSLDPKEQEALVNAKWGKNWMTNAAARNQKFSGAALPGGQLPS